MMGKPQASGNLEKLANAFRQARECKAENLTWYMGDNVSHLLTMYDDVLFRTLPDMTVVYSLYGIPAKPDDALGSNIIELRGDNFSAVIELEPPRQPMNPVYQK